jgi:hypothetical protein
LVYRVQVCRSFRDIKTRKPRTKILLHLGSIGAEDFNTPHERLRFWLDAERSLSKNQTFSASQKQQVRTILARKIARPRLGLPLAP